MATRSRGSNFSVAEEIQLCRSYLAIGKDATTATNQTAGTFWERIWQHFEKAMGPGAEERTLRSLESKWSIINAGVSKFVGAMAIAVGTPVSGESAEDRIDRATKTYHALQGNPAAEEDTTNTPSTKNNTKKKAKGLAFRFLHCWRVLETEPKWQTFREDGEQTQGTDDISVVSPPPVTQRPAGIKASKAEAKSAAVMEATYKRLASATTQLARSSIKQVKALEDASNLVLFSTPLASLDPAGQSFYELRRAAVLQDMAAIAADTPLSQTVPVNNGKEAQGTEEAVGSCPI
ncbi:hypothetical protein BBJ28_00011862 [Nothophytophthora sp. Chile5]|nr:hypothetical protein BBJ28_00011862 [Nothophytophthora sp. Chile5]